MVDAQVNAWKELDNACEYTKSGHVALYESDFKATTLRCDARMRAAKGTPNDSCEHLLFDNYISALPHP